MSDAQRWFNVLLGLSLIGSAVAGIVNHFQERPVAVSIATTLLLLVIGVLAISRQAIVRNGRLLDCIVALPSIAIGGWIFSAAPQVWSWPSQAVFVAGCGLAITSFIFLGKSFAILPAVRAVVIRGPYQIIRHPAYLGELAMALGCCLALEGWIYFIAFAGVTGFVAWRILVEEKLLSSDSNYQVYRFRIKWRLVPGIW